MSDPKRCPVCGGAIPSANIGTLCHVCTIRLRDELADQSERVLRLTGQPVERRRCVDLASQQVYTAMRWVGAALAGTMRGET